MPVAIFRDAQGQPAGFFLNKEGAWQPSEIKRNAEGKAVVFDGVENKWADAGVSPSMSAGDIAKGFGRSAASGATLGWADEIEAALRGKPAAEMHKVYENIPASIKVPGEITGAIGATAATMPLGLLSGVARIPAAARAIGGGLLSGIVAGAGNAPEGEKIGGAVTGGLVGAGTGATIPAVMGVGSKLMRPGLNAAADIGRGMRRDEMTPQQFKDAFDEIKKVDPNAVPADVAGKNLRGVFERVANTPGEGGKIANEFVETRQRGQMDRLATGIKDLTGTKQSAVQTIDDLVAERKQLGAPAYKTAMDFNARSDQDIVTAWSLATGDGWGKSFMMRPEFRKTLQTEYGIKDPAQAPLMVQIDAWKKVADDFVKDNVGTNKARVVDNMIKRVLEVVDTKNPAYAEARNLWAGPSKFMDTIEEGKNIFKTPAEELQAQFAKMGDSEKEAYTIGAVSSIVQKLRSSTAELPNSTVNLRSPEMRDKILELMPTPELKDKWAKLLDYEIGTSKLTAQAIGNSATARRMAEQADRENLASEIIADTLKGKGIVGTILDKTMTQPFNWASGKVREGADTTVANVLTGQQPLDPILDVIARRVGTSQGPPSTARAAAVNATNQGLLDLNY